MNYISENLLSLTRLIVDDSSLFFSASNIHDIEGILNHYLLMLTQWVRKWMFNLCPNKSEAMLFRYLQDQAYPILLFDNVNVKFVSEHKHLGLTFSENMKWKCRRDSIY